ncbi:hypothetical protein GCM10010492_60250 [Saccharothrix mutabilis subsp. mutabilis]|uniref:Uncharacterized protein n=1 Tax=Saccharothrix mutabilis subsp. mutabilis TaxID=66855 RepID=A0ABN0UII6_9PSEU
MVAGLRGRARAGEDLVEDDQAHLVEVEAVVEQQFRDEVIGVVVDQGAAQPAIIMAASTETRLPKHRD